MADGIGDRLARGEKSASFVTSDGKVSQQRWDDIFADWEPETSASATTKTNEIDSEWVPTPKA